MNDREGGLDAVLAELRQLPHVDSDAKARVLIAVAAERERDREAARRRVAWRGRLRWIGSGAALVAATLIGVVVLRPAPNATSPSTPAAVATTSTPTGAQLASENPAALEMAAQSVQFVFSAPTAANVRVVGDFNSWDTSRSPMVRDSASGLWSATVLIRPGRHVYAFVVNDSVWMRDPRAVAAPDADFGRPGSVLLVGRSPGEAIR